jgi:hypothetical protein
MEQRAAMIAAAMGCSGVVVVYDPTIEGDDDRAIAAVTGASVIVALPDNRRGDRAADPLSGLSY